MTKILMKRLEEFSVMDDFYLVNFSVSPGWLNILLHAPGWDAAEYWDILASLDAKFQGWYWEGRRDDDETERVCDACSEAKHDDTCARDMHAMCDECDFVACSVSYSDSWLSDSEVNGTLCPTCAQEYRQAQGKVTP